jgi:DNA-binding CsgD family transcriptional regulator
MLQREHGNIRAAFETCFSEPGSEVGLRMTSALWFFWIATGLTNEGRRWLERGLELDKRPSRTRARALWVCGYLCTIQEDTATARIMLDECKLLAARTEDAVATAWAVQLDGMVAMSDGELSSARRLLDEALDRHRTAGNRLGILDASFYLVGVTAFLGDGERAVRICEDAIALCDTLGDRWLKSYMLWDRALAAWQRDNGARAAESAQEGLRLAREFNEQWVIAFCLEILAWAASGEQAHERAARLLGAADRLWRRIGAPLFCMRHLVSVHDHQKDQVRRALGGKAYDTEFERGDQMGIDDAISYALEERSRTRKAAATHRPKEALTRREREVASLIADGMSNKEIAAKLVISRRTAEAHVEHILNKLGYTSRAQIAAWVAEQRGANPVAR